MYKPDIVGESEHPCFIPLSDTTLSCVSLLICTFAYTMVYALTSCCKCCGMPNYGSIPKACRECGGTPKCWRCS